VVPVLVSSLHGPNEGMPRVQAAAASAVATFCNPEHMRPEWLGLDSGAEPGAGVATSLLGGLFSLLQGSTLPGVKMNAFTAVAAVAQVCKLI
ncbi:unnamed protein product, partial [Choristocarpus tenellus]